MEKLTRTEQVLAVLKAGGTVATTCDRLYVLRDRNGQHVDAWQNAIKAAWRIDLHAKQDAYVASLKAEGALVGSYDPPCGCAPIEAAIPPEGETWDSVVICPRCLEFHAKVATHEGVRTEALAA